MCWSENDYYQIMNSVYTTTDLDFPFCYTTVDVRLLPLPPLYIFDRYYIILILEVLFPSPNSLECLLLESSSTRQVCEQLPLGCSQVSTGM